MAYITMSDLAGLGALGAPWRWRSAAEMARAQEEREEREAAYARGARKRRDVQDIRARRAAEAAKIRRLREENEAQIRAGQASDTPFADAWRAAGWRPQPAPAPTSPPRWVASLTPGYQQAAQARSGVPQGGGSAAGRWFGSMAR
jgi:hypothetical protein